MAVVSFLSERIFFSLRNSWILKYGVSQFYSAKKTFQIFFKHADKQRQQVPSFTVPRISEESSGSLCAQTSAVWHKRSWGLPAYFSSLLLLKLDLPFLGELTVLSVARTTIWSVRSKLMRRRSWVRSIESPTYLSARWIDPSGNFWSLYILLMCA